MKRLITHTVFYLFLGIVTTVAVAWGCGFVSKLNAPATVPVGGGASIVGSEPSTTFLVYNDETNTAVDAGFYYRGLGISRIFWFVEGIVEPNSPSVFFLTTGANGKIISARFLAVGPIHKGDLPLKWSKRRLSRGSAKGATSFAIEDAVGFPFRAMHGVSESASTTSWQTKNGIFTTNAFPLTYGGTSAPYGEFRILPLRPIFPGFIFNTLFYAAIWFALFATFAFARKTLRNKRGRCIKCNYDLRGTPANSPTTVCPECGWGR